MQMKKVLLLGSSYSAIPMLRYLKSRGFFVGVMGAFKSDPCHLFADDSHFSDYSKAVNISNILKDFNYDFIVPSSNDFSYLAGAEVASELNFPGFDRIGTVNALHNKLNFRYLLRELNIPAPNFQVVSGETFKIKASILRFPLLVKPVDSFSGRGLTKVDAPERLDSAVIEAREESRSKECLIEEFFEGALFSHSAFIRDKKIMVDFFVDEFCTVYQYQVNCSHHPSSLHIHVQNLVREFIAKIIVRVGLCDGLLHTQFMVNNLGELKIIETMRRAPGDLYGRLIELSTGYAYTAAYVKPFLAESFLDSDVFSRPFKFVSRHTVSSEEDCTPVACQTLSTLGSLMEWIQLKESGQELKRAPYGKYAILFLGYPNFQELISETPKLASKFMLN